jgi:hypothetical protein
MLGRAARDEGRNSERVRSVGYGTHVSLLCHRSECTDSVGRCEVRLTPLLLMVHLSQPLKGKR